MESDKKHRPLVYSRKKPSGQTPAFVILFSFLILIASGCFLLLLPGVAKTPLTLFQAFFTSTSVSCVTGIQIVKMENFTFLGQLIIMGLIQVGGIGFMTLSFFIISFFAGNLSFAGRSLAGEILNFDSQGKINYFIYLIIQTTLIIEFLGAMLLYPEFAKTLPGKQAFFYSVFYSISSFCNAGVSLYDDSIAAQIFTPKILTICSILVILGGIGFFVFYEVYSYAKNKILSKVDISCRKFHALSLHTRIVLFATLALIILGTIFVIFLEWNNVLQSNSILEKFFQSLFYSISLRSAGYLTFDPLSLKTATLFFSMILMLIGASPGSTGGGIKTTTFVIFISTLSSILQGKTYVEIGKRTIPTNQIYRTISVVIVGLFWIFASTFILLLTESNLSFFELLFESTSALSTTGISIGITSSLTFVGKIVIIINMLAGRIGYLTLIFAIRQRHEKQPYKYPEEKVLLG